MQKLKAYAKKIGAITAMGALVGVSFLGGCVTDEQAQADIDSALKEAKVICGEGTLLKEFEDGNVCFPTPVSEVIEPEMVDKEVLVFNELWSEDYDLSEKITAQLGDKKIVKLIDGKIEVDDEDYDVAEYLVLNLEEDGDLKLVTSSMADKDMEDNLYLHVGENGIRYEYRFEDALPKLVDEDVTIKFLGKDMKIVNFGSDSITVKEGITESVSIGGSVEDATVVGISEDLVKVKVGDKTVYLHEGDVETVNDVEVSVDSIFYVAEKEDREAELTVGKDIERTIESGDSYDSDIDEDDSEWVWDIHANEDGLHEVALVYNQRRNDVDDDSDFKALPVGGEIVLPNDYLRVKLDGTNEPDYLSVDLYDKEEGIYKLVGNFVYDVEGSEDYDKVYLFNGEFYEDFDHSVESLIGTELKLDDTEATLVSSVESEVQHLVLNVGDETHELLHLTTEFAEDETVMTSYGVKFINSEDWVEDDSNKLTIKVPEEQLEGTISVGGEVTKTISVPKEPVLVTEELVIEEPEVVEE